VDDTGRIRRPLTPTARRIVFGPPAPGPSELLLVTWVDRAHLVMLAEQGIVHRAAAAALLVEIEHLRAVGFAPLEGAEARRGRYLLYEDWLAARLGDRTAGILRTGRSRNDLNATVLRLRLRPPVERLLTETLRLQAVLLAGARRHARTVMPGYTHYQPAVPTTYGHHLGGVARAVDRDLEALGAASAGLDACPLGAGTGYGSAMPIAPARTAALLGFERPEPHALDAVASRDVVLRLLAAAAVFGVTASRLAADLLEHVQGRSARAAGAFVAAATAMHATPFANSVAVGTEGCAGTVETLEATADCAALLRLVVAGAQPRPGAMLARAAAGQTTATAAAERLVIEEGMSFREAHRLVGQLLTEADRRSSATPVVPQERWNGGEPTARRSSQTPVVPEDRRKLADGLDPAAVAGTARFGGGPGGPSALDDLRRRRATVAGETAGRVRRWRRADTDLAAAVAAVIESPGPAPSRPVMLTEAGRRP